MNRHRAKQIAQELQLLNSHRLPNVRFHGMSMVPFLQDGDRVLVEPVEWQDIEPGDIITYRNSDKYPSRRVVKKTANTLHLWCDNWPSIRFSAKREEVLGRAVACERDGVWIFRGQPDWEDATRSALRKYRRTRLLRLKVRVKGAIFALRSKFK
jgi:signal peptidase I